jgi:chromosome segregation ATPase
MANSAHDRRRRRSAVNAPAEVAPAGEAHDAGDDFPVLVFAQERLRAIAAEKEELEERHGRVLDENEVLHQRLETESDETQRLRESLERANTQALDAEERFEALHARLARVEKDAQTAKAEVDGLRTLLREESAARCASESELANLRVTVRADRDTHDAGLSATRKKLEEAQDKLAREKELRRSISDELKSAKARAVRTENTLRSEIRDLRGSHARLEEHIAGIQRELEVRSDELEVKEHELGRRLEATRIRESDLVSKRADLEREAARVTKSLDELAESAKQLHAREEDMERREEALEAREADPRVIRLDAIDEKNVDEKEVLGLLMAERHERGAAEAELERIQERAVLLERELARINGRPRVGGAHGRRRR